MAAVVLLGASSGGIRESVASQPRSVAVVVAARAIPAGEFLVAGDVRTGEVPEDAALASLCRDAAAAIGRRVDVALTKGDLLTTAMLEPRAVVPAPSRVVPLAVDPRQIAAGVGVNDEVEIVAAVAGSGDQPNQVRSVARGRVLGIDGPVGATVALTIGCSDEDAMRILWALAFAHSVSVLLGGGDGHRSAALSSLSEPA